MRVWHPFSCLFSLRLVPASLISVAADHSHPLSIMDCIDRPAIPFRYLAAGVVCHHDLREGYRLMGQEGGIGWEVVLPQKHLNHKHTDFQESGAHTQSAIDEARRHTGRDGGGSEKRGKGMTERRTHTEAILLLHHFNRRQCTLLSIALSSPTFVSRAPIGGKRRTLLCIPAHNRARHGRNWTKQRIFHHHLTRYCC